MTEFVSQGGMEIFSEIINLQKKKKIPSTGIVVSPYSIMSVLVPLYFASSGETKTELQNTFKLEGKLACLKFFESIFKAISQCKFIKQYNIVAMREDLKIKRKFYKSTKHLTEFTYFPINDPKSILQKINQKVSK